MCISGELRFLEETKCESTAALIRKAGKNFNVFYFDFTKKLRGLFPRSFCFNFYTV